MYENASKVLKTQLVQYKKALHLQRNMKIVSADKQRQGQKYSTTLSSSFFPFLGSDNTQLFIFLKVIKTDIRSISSQWKPF